MASVKVFSELFKLCTLFSYACSVHLLSLVQWFIDIVNDNGELLYMGEN